ncbi:uncharacterized protein LOC121737930 [Aricia agestis]|uniref:uncharacterized protein LOC121737930 n=1 Tax=Aricia agestis TaxID=91739 RepID=UPI001C207A79|nr:uncharacterized protein LOC121737930 [Aricia agestis]XP_041985597.1 uncharacterized protein LOC121737930 [Aricia agestis]
MTTPILLEGSNLGERHKYYNQLVTTTLKQNVTHTEILQAPEESPIDRLFKIDVASERRDVEYILQNLKDDDMLYVSRALKSLWLLEPRYCDVINPRYLEDEVFPHMIQPAVNKMRHWLHKNLTDSTRCQQFYEYYKDRDIAIKFLWHCPADYILAEIKNVVHILSPQDFKVLCESCPQAARVYYEGLQANNDALLRYIKSEETYFKSIQCVLKTDSCLYLDIVEKYFNMQKFGKLSPEATRYIIKNFKDRFDAKPELYTVYFLRTKTLARLLTSEEAKTLILKLAQAEYLENWFTYKNIEPLILKVNANERAAFKKQIFVDKNVGDKIKEWKYPIPIKIEPEIIRDRNIFKDAEAKPICFERQMRFKRMLKKRKYGKWDSIVTQKSPLDLLFDKYRFKNFNSAFHELTQKLPSEGTIEGRMNIFLVLVSKSGGVPEQVDKLLTLLVTKHMNEPSNLRAAVVRSLVKRAAAWRLPDPTWDMMINFGHHLGLDGGIAELECIEGIHAVVLRHLINDIPLTDAIITAFLKDSSTLRDYKLNFKERAVVGPRLAKIFLDSEPNMFLDTLDEYKLEIKDILDAETTLVEKARTDAGFLRQLFDRKIGRRLLLKETFQLIDNDASYINVLKHDASVLENGVKFASLLKEKRPHHDRFLRALALYFNEPNGLAELHKTLLLDEMKSNPQSWIARAINILSTNLFLNLKVVDDIDNKADKKRLGAAFRATAHKIRPTLNIDSVDWQTLGAKAVANKVFICRAKDQKSYVNLLLQWRRTVRIATRLGLSSKSSKEIFVAASKLRPAAVLKMAAKTYLRQQTIDPQVWEVIKKLIKELVTDKRSKYLLNSLKKNKNIPDDIKAEYWVLLYEVFSKINKEDATNILCKVENVLPLVEDHILIRSIIDKYLNKEFVFENIVAHEYEKTEIHGLNLRIMVKYLMMCTSEIEQKERLDNVCDAFFNKAATLNETLGEEAKKKLYGLLYRVIRALKYNKAYLGNYACSLPVFQRIMENMKKILPMEQYLALYIEIRIIMLYYNSVKESMKENPSIFEKLDKNIEDAIESVGVKLGERIDSDIKQLTVEYFFSIVDIYKHVLVLFLHHFEYDEGHNPIALPMIKGMFCKKRTESLVLVEHIFSRGECPIDHRDKTLDTLKSFNNTIINMLIYAHS